MRRVVWLYAVVVAAVFVVLMRNDRRPAQLPAQTQRTVMNWSDVKDKIKVDAKPSGVWTWAYDYVRGPALIQIEAGAEQWSYSPGKKCGADGDLGSLLNKEGAILPGAPIGALIVKIGGSTAGVTDGTVRVAGSKALIAIDEKVSGPIFLTINDEVTGLSDNADSITVKVSIAAQPGKAAETPSK